MMMFAVIVVAVYLVYQRRKGASRKSDTSREG